MSVNVLSWVLEHSESEGSDRLVLITLADRADPETWSAFPGVADVAARARVSERTVQRCLRSLEALGELRVEVQRGGTAKMVDAKRPNRYTITPRQSVTPPPVDLSPGVTQGPDRVTPMTGAGDTAVTQTVIEPSGNRHSLAPASPAPVENDLSDAVSSECGIDRTQLTPSARGSLNTAVAGLRRVGADPTEVAARASAFRLRYPTATLTPPALAKHWPSLGTSNGQDPQVTPDARSITIGLAEELAGFGRTYAATDLEESEVRDQAARLFAEPHVERAMWAWRRVCEQEAGNA
jgi:hypothetical protein